MIAKKKFWLFEFCIMYFKIRKPVIIIPKFDTYKHLERGKTTEIVGWQDKDEAYNTIEEAIKQYLNQ
jgi:inorganic pyrophosphatase